MKALLPIGYFPPISYFAYVLRADVTLERHEHYVKQSLRSRCTIIGANGPLQLHVPRSKTDQRQTIGQCAIHNTDEWRKLHWRSLVSAYRNSPYFAYYEDELLPFFEEEHTNLFELGLKSLHLVCGILGIERTFQLTEHYVADFQGLDLRNAWNKRNYELQSPIQHFPSYIQVFSDRFAFMPDLSILDLVFCQGPRSVEYLQNLKLSYS